jgi:ribosomal protein S6
LISIEEARLQAAFLDRLLHIDSMRLLSRKEGSISARKGSGTLVLNKPDTVTDQSELDELHLDYVVSQYLLDLRESKPGTFDRVSDIAFANMAAEALACFDEPPSTQTTLTRLTVYLDSPLLLDMLGVNSEYAEYGAELLEAIKASGAKAAAFDHSVNEAESVVNAQLAYLRSGINHATSRWGVTARPDLLSALIGNVGVRATNRLGIEIHRDPELNLHRRAQGTVGDIEAEMNKRMQAWGTAESREYDRKSVWSMLSIQDTGTPSTRVCDSKQLLLARNTALVNIANAAWLTWLKGTTRHSHTQIEKWAPIAMSDKQFAGYLWLRGGSRDGSISRSRLLAHCSAAVRPRADVKARAYNLVLDLSGRQEADDVAALLEDREGARALMRATRGDPEDVTRERLPYILEQVKMAAGEYAAAIVRTESEKALETARTAHAEELEVIRRQAKSAEDAKSAEAEAARQRLLQAELSSQALAERNAVLQRSLTAAEQAEEVRRKVILQTAFIAGAARYSALRWLSAIGFGILSGVAACLSSIQPTLSVLATVLIEGVQSFV